MGTVIESSRSRGQLILLGGLTLAVVLVGLAVVLNAAISTENLANEGTATGADDALTFRAETEVAVRGLLEDVNDEGGGETELRGAIEQWGETTALQYARNGVDVSVEYVGGNPPANAEVRVTYRTEQVYYETTFQVEPRP